jgi:hypothetical protein
MRISLCSIASALLIAINVVHAAARPNVVIIFIDDMWIDPANTLAKDLVVREGLTRAEVEAGHRHKIWPLMEGEQGAKSPHETYALPHGPGTVRSGKWKYYPWQ